MCFGRLIGAATGLEVARGGDDHELVEDLKWDGQREMFRVPMLSSYFFSFLSMRETQKYFNLI